MAAMDWSERKRMIVTLSVGVALNLAVAYFLYAANKTYNAQVASHAKKLAEIKDLKITADKELPLEITLNGMNKDFKTNMKQLPEVRDNEMMITDISKRAHDAGAVKLSIDEMPVVVETGAGGSIKKTVFKTRWKADFKSWCTLVNSLEEYSPRFVAFENMVITPSNSGLVPTGSAHDIAVDLVVYQYVRQP